MKSIFIICLIFFSFNSNAQSSNPIETVKTVKFFSNFETLEHSDSELSRISAIAYVRLKELCGTGGSTEQDPSMDITNFDILSLYNRNEDGTIKTPYYQARTKAVCIERN